MSHLWGIVQAHRDHYGPSVSEIARRMDVGSQTLFNWRDRPLRELPSKRVLLALSEVTGTSYSVVLRAALLDTGYETDETVVPDMPPQHQRDSGSA